MDRTKESSHKIPYMCPLKLVQGSYRLGPEMQFSSDPKAMKLSRNLSWKLDELFGSNSVDSQHQIKYELQVILSEIKRLDPQPLTSATQSELYFNLSKTLFKAALIAKEFSKTIHEELLQKANFFEVLALNTDPKLRRPVANVAHRLLATHLMHWCRLGKIPLKPAISNESQLATLFKACCDSLDIGIPNNCAYYLRYARDMCELAEKNKKKYGKDWERLENLAVRAVQGKRLPAFYPPALVFEAGRGGATWLMARFKDAGYECTNEEALRHEYAVNALVCYHFQPAYRQLWDNMPWPKNV